MAILAAMLWRRLDTPGHDVFGYEGLLELASNGFIRRYPGLWEAEQVL